MPFPAEEERIEAAEAELGRRLPPPVRERLRRDNGGEVSVGGEPWQLHPVFDDADRRRAARTASHVVHETAEARGWDGFPPDAVAIASDGTGDRLIVAAGSDDVARWSHEDAATEPVDVDWG